MLTCAEFRIENARAAINESSWVARRPKIGIEISISVSGSIGTESWKSASNSAVRSPDPHVAITQVAPKTFPDIWLRLKVGKTTKLQKQHCTSALG